MQAIGVQLLPLHAAFMSLAEYYCICAHTSAKLVHLSTGCDSSCADHTLASIVDSNRPDHDPSECQVNHVQRQAGLKLAAGSGACVRLATNGPADCFAAVSHSAACQDVP